MDTNITPKISIITITKDRAKFIPEALKSVQKQDFSAWELLVLDDASNDNTEAIVSEYKAKDPRIKYHNNPQGFGISKNRNIGLNLSKGKYIAVLDSDDMWIDKDKLQKQFDFLERNLDYVLIGSNVKIVDDKNIFIKNTDFETDDSKIRNKILRENQIPHSTVMYRKDLAEKVGGYDEKLSCVEDLDFFLKLGLLGKFKNLKEITTAYTRHSGGISHKRKMAMAWNHYKIVWRNFGKYPKWLIAEFWAELRLLKNLF